MKRYRDLFVLDNELPSEKTLLSIILNHPDASSVCFGSLIITDAPVGRVARKEGHRYALVEPILPFEVLCAKLDVRMADGSLPKI